MDVIFHSLRLKRFKSFVDDQTLKFGGSGLFFLKGKNILQPGLGSNGAGKSSIVDALCWCLYGKTLNGLRNTDVVPWSGKGASIVTIELSVDGKDHTIERQTGPNIVTIDGVEVSTIDIEKLIQIPLELLPYTIVFGQRQPLFLDLTAGEKLKLLSKFRNLERWDERSERVGKSISTIEDTLSTLKNAIAVQRELVARADKDITSIEEQSNEWEDQQLKLSDTAETFIKRTKEAIAIFQKDRDSFDLRLEDCEVKLRTSQIEKLRKQCEPVLAQKTALEKRLAVELNLKALHEAKLISADERNCPTCGQPISNHTYEGLWKEIRAEIAKCNATISTIEKELVTIKTDYDRLISTIEAETEAQSKFKKDADNAREGLLRSERQLAIWEAELKAKEALVEDAEARNNPFRTQLASLKKRRATALAALEDYVSTIETESARYERLKFWVSGFKNIKLYIIEDILAELELETNNVLDSFGLAGWSVGYDIERETKKGTAALGINTVVLSPTNKDPAKWQSWSGGEAQRLRLIGSAALSNVLLGQLGITTNLEIYDEPTESLSREGVADLVDVLAQRARETKKAVWLIDHHTIESSRFAETVEVVKDDKGSRFT